MSKKNSKQKVLHAALMLFYQKGFHATSVRDIADKAKVNVSLISYYFKGKQGLLEYTVIHYYERYIKEIQIELERATGKSSLEQLKEVIRVIIRYKQEHQKLSCFIHRELSVDTTFIREILLTYIAKENYYLKKLFMDVVEEVPISQIEKEFTFMQLKGMLATPYTLHNEFKQTLISPMTDEHFVKQYVKTIFSWLNITIG